MNQEEIDKASIKYTVENLEFWKAYVERENPIPMQDTQSWLYNLTKMVLYLYQSSEVKTE
jgi:hypothetical protein